MIHVISMYATPKRKFPPLSLFPYLLRNEEESLRCHRSLSIASRVSSAEPVPVSRDPMSISGDPLVSWEKETTMQYLLLIYEGEKRLVNQSKPDFEAELAEYRAFGKQFAGAIKGGSALQPTRAATTVRVRDG